MFNAESASFRVGRVVPGFSMARRGRMVHEMAPAAWARGQAITLLLRGGDSLEGDEREHERQERTEQLHRSFVLANVFMNWVCVWGLCTI